jgi:aspartyl protease family protein
MSQEMPRTLKVVTVWLLAGTLLFLAVQAFLAQQQRARFQASDMGVIELRRAPDGHFHWPARVNGHSVEFLVDTGATRTALPGALAAQLGLERGRTIRSSTAGGTAEGYESRIELALEGGLRVERLRVTVLPALAAPLLGMDVLSQLRFAQHDGVLRLQPPP